jgi:DNA-binding IclR family transcriptional regulator
MTDTKIDQRSARRVCLLMKALKGRSMSGQTLAALSSALGEQPSTVLRTLRTMQDEGFALFVDDEQGKRWTLYVELLGIAQAHQEAMARYHARGHEFTSRVNAASAT